MKLRYLHIVGFQGIHTLGIDDPMPVIVISGPNASGKSSVRDAIRFALDGGSGRVGLKKDYADWLVNDKTDKKNAIVTVQLDDIEYQRKVATGHVTTDDEYDFPALLPFLIGVENLSQVDIKTAQRAVINATGLKITKDVIKNRLIEHGADERLVEVVLPYLRSGWSAAHKEAKRRISEKRGEWKGITGETYGVKKAKSWKPEPIDSEALIGECTDNIRKYQKQREEFLEKQDKAPRAPRKGVSMNYSDIGACPGCGAELRRCLTQHKLYVKGTEPAVPAASSAPIKGDTFESLANMIQAADQAIGTEQARIAEIEREAGALDEKAAKAFAVYRDINAWTILTDLLAPDGLPKIIISEALDPINKRMLDTSITTGWPVTVLSDECQVVFNGRPYGICSESERWRANAAVAEALAYVSGIKFFLLDRMDVLEPAARGKFIKWIESIKDEHDTIIFMASLKKEPPVPYGFTSVWLGEKAK